MRQLLDERDDVEVIAEYADATVSEKRLHSADVIFLDVLLPEPSGLDLARLLPRAGPPFVVFVTAYDEYAVPAFETEALDYLTKPVAADRLTKTLARVRKRLQSDANETPQIEQLVTRVGDRDIIIPVADIDSLEADGVYAAVTVGQRRYLVRSSLDALERTLQPAAFIRAHRSWIVPRDRIERSSSSLAPSSPLAGEGSHSLRAPCVEQHYRLHGRDGREATFIATQRIETARKALVRRRPGQTCVLALTGATSLAAHRNRLPLLHPARDGCLAVLPSDTPLTAIRPATPADLPAIGRLGALLVRTHHAFDSQRFLEPTPQTENAYASFLGSQLDEPSILVLVAERDGEVLGYSYAGVEGHDYMSLRGPAGVLHDIVVDPAHRGHGVGRALLDATLAALAAGGAPRVVLSTAEQNESAQRLFARAGFRRTMIEMTRELDGSAPARNL